MTTQDASPLDRGAYLIVLEDYLVSQDLAEIVAWYAPAAEVIVRHALPDAVAALQPVARLAVAFVGIGPASFAASPLAAMIASRGGRVVLLGDEAERTGEAAGWAVLQRPFSQSQVATFLTDPDAPEPA